MVRLESHEEIAVLHLENGVTNSITPQLVSEMDDHLKKLKEASGVRALVLTGTGDKFFSIGLDIPSLFPLDEEEFLSFYRAFNRLCLALFTFPRPTFAAITGHAIAGGCILALCCDYRHIAEGRKLMGLNEVQLGVPVPYVADCILRHLVGLRHAREIMDAGEFYGPEDLLRFGVVDRVLPLEDVLPASIERARLLGGFPQKAFASIKHNRVEGIEAEILNRLVAKERSFVECWHSHEARELLKAAMEKF